MGHSYGSESTNSNTATELLPEAEYVNGIYGESPSSSIPEIQPQTETTPEPPTNDAT